MNFPVFQIINLVLIFIVLLILIIYVWGIFIGTVHAPAEWRNARKSGKISNDLLKLARGYSDKARFYTWWFQVERLRKEHVKGAFAELGVYQGDSARILHKMDPTRTFHLFDTFAGFPGSDLENETGEAATYTTRNFADTNIGKVKRRIGGNENVAFHQGYFPETTVGLENVTYSLVNMDADLYNPTKAGLDYFYHRLMPGGVIFIHDYNHKWPGIIKAVDEFCGTIPEIPILIPDKEGTVMIIKSKKS